MRYKHTSRPGFLLGFIDFFTAGIFFLLYMPFGGLQDELEDILGHKVMPYWKAYLLGIPNTFHLYACMDGTDCRGVYKKVMAVRWREHTDFRYQEMGFDDPEKIFMNSLRFHKRFP